MSIARKEEPSVRKKQGSRKDQEVKEKTNTPPRENIANEQSMGGGESSWVRGSRGLQQNKREKHADGEQAGEKSHRAPLNNTATKRSLYTIAEETLPPSVQENQGLWTDQRGKQVVGKSRPLPLDNDENSKHTPPPTGKKGDPPSNLGSQELQQEIQGRKQERGNLSISRTNHTKEEPPSFPPKTQGSLQPQSPRKQQHSPPTIVEANRITMENSPHSQSRNSPGAHHTIPTYAAVVQTDQQPPRSDPSLQRANQELQRLPLPSLPGGTQDSGGPNEQELHSSPSKEVERFDATSRTVHGTSEGGPTVHNMSSAPTVDPPSPNRGAVTWEEQPTSGHNTDRGQRQGSSRSPSNKTDHPLLQQVNQRLRGLFLSPPPEGTQNPGPNQQGLHSSPSEEVQKLDATSRTVHGTLGGKPAGSTMSSASTANNPPSLNRGTTTWEERPSSDHNANRGQRQGSSHSPTNKTGPTLQQTNQKLQRLSPPPKKAQDPGPNQQVLPPSPSGGVQQLGTTGKLAPSAGHTTNHMPPTHTTIPPTDHPSHYRKTVTFWEQHPFGTKADNEPYQGRPSIHHPPPPEWNAEVKDPSFPLSAKGKSSQMKSPPPLSSEITPPQIGSLFLPRPRVAHPAQPPAVYQISPQVQSVVPPQVPPYRMRSMVPPQVVSHQMQSMVPPQVVPPHMQSMIPPQVVSHQMQSMVPPQVVPPHMQSMIPPQVVPPHMQSMVPPQVVPPHMQFMVPPQVVPPHMQSMVPPQIVPLHMQSMVPLQVVPPHMQSIVPPQVVPPHMQSIVPPQVVPPHMNPMILPQQIQQIHIPPMHMQIERMQQMQQIQQIQIQQMQTQHAQQIHEIHQIQKIQKIQQTQHTQQIQKLEGYSLSPYPSGSRGSESGVRNSPSLGLCSSGVGKRLSGVCDSVRSRTKVHAKGRRIGYKIKGIDQKRWRGGGTGMRTTRTI
ncbi:hypothetical protein [Pasteuria penetrans]|uniref:hypothetical protein n=1 Tax=Pasteuria penetrans TaxID=86005 RepID=UPI0011EDE82B|nr:hypothetical protein [Pasteuria penetrans]